MKEAIIPDAVLDITSETCPMTFVRTRLALDSLQDGAHLAIRLRGEEPVRNVPRMAAAQGHAIIAETTGADGVTELILRKNRRN